MTSLLVLVSAVSSFYMTFYGVVIGYGIAISVLTTDVDLSKELVGINIIIWSFFFGILPLWVLNLKVRYLPTSYKLLKTRNGFAQITTIIILTIVVLMTSIRYFDYLRAHSKRSGGRESANLNGIVFHSYVPSNWLVGLGIHCANIWDGKVSSRKLFDPSRHFTYVANHANDNTYLVFVIGETARYDHMNLFGYHRETSDFLKKEKNLVAIRGLSSETSTRLSLSSMFVREGGYDRKRMMPKEENVFSVLKSLGFTSELFAMQGEVWFYNSVRSDFYKFREVIASEQSNTGKPIDDMLLIPELEQSLNRHRNGKHVVIIHTKGQHYLYTNRYPRSFARFTPECLGVDESCSEQKQYNSYDNSLLYTDFFLSRVIKALNGKKALMFYTSDHGESIGDNMHLHGTPLEVAPPEQRMVPFVIWASDRYLAIPENRHAFEQLKSHKGEVRRHEEMFDTLLGCLGYSSPDNGINQQNNWCR